MMLWMLRYHPQTEAGKEKDKNLLFVVQFRDRFVTFLQTFVQAGCQLNKYRKTINKVNKMIAHYHDLAIYPEINVKVTVNKDLFRFREHVFHAMEQYHENYNYEEYLTTDDCVDLLESVGDRAIDHIQSAKLHVNLK